VAKLRARTDLLVDCASIPEDDVAADEAGEERVETSFFATIHLLLDQQQGLVQRNVFHEVCSVGLGRLKYRACPGAPATGNEYMTPPRDLVFAHSLSTTEQNGHDQRMRETDLDTIDETIPSTLQHSEVVVVSWVGDYVLDAGHRRVQ